MTDNIIENTEEQISGSPFTEDKIENETPDTVTFEDLGLDEYTLKAVEKKGFVTPSPIQVLAIPRLLTGDTNLIARARTGTGKTAAFGLPFRPVPQCSLLQLRNIRAQLCFMVVLPTLPRLRTLSGAARLLLELLAVLKTTLTARL